MMTKPMTPFCEPENGIVRAVAKAVLGNGFQRDWTLGGFIQPRMERWVVKDAEGTTQAMLVFSRTSELAGSAPHHLLEAHIASDKEHITIKYFAKESGKLVGSETQSLSRAMRDRSYVSWDKIEEGLLPHPPKHKVAFPTRPTSA
jgi:hypothetical protein